jgi:hypothetical protein
MYSSVDCAILAEARQRYYIHNAVFLHSFMTDVVLGPHMKNEEYLISSFSIKDLELVILTIA